MLDSPNWKDYVIEGDVQVLSGGSGVGVLARVNEAEVGENSFKGYLAAVRENSLVLGVFDFAYHEVSKIRMPDAARPYRWYHIKLKVNGCQITASARPVGMAEVETAPLNDADCFRSGTAGLGRMAPGGVWRNVSVTPVGLPVGGQQYNAERASAGFDAIPARLDDLQSPAQWNAKWCRRSAVSATSARELAPVFTAFRLPSDLGSRICNSYETRNLCAGFERRG